MKRTTRVIGIVILLTFVLPPSISVCLAHKAVDEVGPITQNSLSYIGTYQILASLSIFGGSAECGSSIDVYSGYEADLTMYLQRKSSAGYWINVSSWSGSTSGSGSANLSEWYSNLVSGTTYRVYAVARVYRNGSFIERVSA